MACAIAALLAVSGAASAREEIPYRVMTLNMCADQLALSLLPPERITSVTYISHWSDDPELEARAAEVGMNFGLAEEVFAQEPDLVITGEYSTPATRAVLRRVGYPFYELSAAETFDQVREQTRDVAAMLGVSERGEDLIAEMDAILRGLERDRPQVPISVIAWNGSGEAPGRNTLFDAILTAAGGVNLAGAHSSAYSVTFDMEELLSAKPDLLAYGNADLNTPSLRHEPLRHPAIQQMYGNRQITYPEAKYVCGTPDSAKAARDLHETMTRVLRDAGQ
jgi:iron complex transport system substrate-binding protein